MLKTIASMERKNWGDDGALFFTFTTGEKATLWRRNPPDGVNEGSEVDVTIVEKPNKKDPDKPYRNITEILPVNDVSLPPQPKPQPKPFKQQLGDDALRSIRIALMACQKEAVRLFIDGPEYFKYTSDDREAQNAGEAILVIRALTLQLATNHMNDVADAFKGEK